MRLESSNFAPDFTHKVDSDLLIRKKSENDFGRGASKDLHTMCRGMSTVAVEERMEMTKVWTAICPRCGYAQKSPAGPDKARFLLGIHMSSRNCARRQQDKKIREAEEGPTSPVSSPSSDSGRVRTSNE